MMNTSSWNGVYNIKAIYKYQKEVEASIAFELEQKEKEVTGKCLFKKQSIWKEDMYGILEGLLDDINSRRVKLNLKWYNSSGNFQNQSDLNVTMANDFNSFEGIIKNMMYTGYYYGTKLDTSEKMEKTYESPRNKNSDNSVNNTNNNNYSNNPIRNPNDRRRKSANICQQEEKLDSSGNRVDSPRKKSTKFFAEENKTSTEEKKSSSPQMQGRSPQLQGRGSPQTQSQGKGLTSEDLKNCIICCEKPKQAVFVPCGHKCCCETCAEKFINKHKCPFCKKSVESIIKKVFET